MRNGVTPLVITVLGAALLAGCDEIPITNEGSGTLSLAIVDAPVDGASRVEITLDSIELKPYAAEIITYTFDPPRKINLLDYQGSNALTLIPNETVVAGKYSWVRLNIDDSKSFVYIGKTPYNITFPDSDAINRTRINDSFTLQQDGNIDVTIDFDLRRSILKPQNVGDDYRLVPSLRLVDNSKTGTIVGTIPYDTVNANGCTNFPAVYLFEGANVTADDVDGTGAEPYASSFLTSNTSGDYDYELGFIPAGNYTIAFTCKANLDDPETSDSDVTFSGTDNVSVTAGETTTYDF